MKNNFDAFKPHYSFMKMSGCYEIDKSNTKMKQTLHRYYRILVLIVFCTFCFQHMVQVYKLRDDAEEMVNTLYVLLTLYNSLGKLLVYNIRRGRIEKIAEAIRGPVFAPNSKTHEELMERNAKNMWLLLRSNHALMIICSLLWMTYPLACRFLGQEVKFDMHFSFSTERLSVFLLVVLYITIMVHWVSLSTATMDCTVYGFYMQARLQLQMLRHNLMHIADLEDEDSNENNEKIEVKLYRDLENMRFNDLFHARLVRCVKRHQLIVWLVDVVESTFRSSMILQFLVMAWVICMTLYKIVSLDFLSAEFMTMIAYMNCVLVQLFLICYFGTQLKDESEFVNQSIYESDWPAVSPRLRRSLLIMMERCYRPIEPCVAYIVPMSLDIFISVVKSSYSLYTFLDRK
nr:odorant receptor 23.2 [Papilio polytes]